MTCMDLKSAKFATFVCRIDLPGSKRVCHPLTLKRSKLGINYGASSLYFDPCPRSQTTTDETKTDTETPKWLDARFSHLRLETWAH